MFLSLYLPRWMLQAAQRWREGNAVSVIVEDKGAKSLVLEVSEKARDFGIEVGMSCPQVMARHMRTEILLRSPAQEECLNQLLIETTLDLSPDVELAFPGICIADLRRKAKPPCWQMLGDDLVRRFQEEKLNVQIGVAGTPDLAVLAAQGREKVSVVYDTAAFVRGLPLSALAISPEFYSVLKDWGIADVKGLLALPSSEVIDRVGCEAENLFKKLSGRHKRPLKLLRQSPTYQEAYDFEYEVETTAPLLFLLRRFLESLTVRLRHSHRVAQKLFLQISLEDGGNYERQFAIPAPTTDVDVLYRILDTHLETLRLDKRPVGIRLEIGASMPVKSQLGLFETAIRDLNSFGVTLARLKALVGNERVGFPRKLDSHAPDAFAMQDFFPVESFPSMTAQRGIPMRRFRPSFTVEVDTKNGVPVFCRSSVMAGRIALHAGPFRASGRWWERQWGREEWDVELEDGSAYRLVREKSGWNVEGSYELH